MASTVRRMPEFRAIRNDPKSALRQELLFAFHILDLFGHPSGRGAHLTARLPGSDTFLFHIHNYGFGEVTPEHIHEADFELNVLSGKDIDVNPTLHIHTRIYMARPDVTCIAHTHAKHVAALSAIGQNIQPVTQSAARLYDDSVFFDEDDGVALGKEPGTLMAQALGARSAMVLKCHGLLAVGRSIPEAVLLANTMEENAEIQLLAMAASGGKLELPSPEGSRRSKEYLRSDRAITRSWATWMRQLERERPSVLNMM